ncbi:MAG: hypothetical protein L0Z62_11145 [Gemmataceae bacterium]|nr:hypothetical protein [Gemmataceae bacterium]
MAADNSSSGLVRRGLLLLGGLLLVMYLFWTLLVRGPQQELPSETRRPEVVAALVAAPTSGFPGTVPWSSLGKTAELMPSAPGWQVRYNATITLARRGSPEVPFDLLTEMLDENMQMRNFRARLQSGREVPDEAAARRTILQALRATVEWHKHPEARQALGPAHAGLQSVYAAIDKLMNSPNLVVRTEAKNVRLALPKS